MFIATLIAADQLDRTAVTAAIDKLNQAHCRPEDWHWIDEGRAADIAFGHDPGQARAILDAPGNLYDVVVQPAVGREKKLLVADMDSTMITVECIDELADYAGIKAEIAAVTEAAMRGELDFAEALDARVALLKGLDATAIDRCLAERVTIMAGAKTLIRTMRARGAETILVSGGFTRFAEPVAAEIGFTQAIANVLEIDGAALAGTVAKPIVDSSTKQRTLLEARDRLGLAAHETLAVGDGANDLAMIKLAGLGVAYHAKPIVAAAAGARIDRADLTALLYAQGIGRGEWVE
ncbi:phosphoserine phosphatase SerB [Hephaestia mangrovi]|uniref:phosphoserine phosphatase SerB n=1 Tax=Hephaestia mangrovi TaxID=2873268 RepID=UPI001CA77819|nr:phosphoserine phosphatase SerB [Hephaestia mangrovi]MBY8827496.1 phosphoserine phosphatase SerB [Hephaestia mangrovi]